MASYAYERFRMGGMSAAKTWIVKRVKRRLGWNVVIVGAALVTTFVMGNSFAAAVVAIGIVVVLSALVLRRRERPAGVDPPRERAPGAPYSVSHVWNVDRRADLTEIARDLNGEGLGLRQRSESADRVVLSGGSQLWTRLFGGYFVDPKRLPIEVELRAANGAASGNWTVQLGVRDRLGIAIRDEALGDRFALAAGNIRKTVGARLEAMGAVEVDPASPAGE
jgi:hypothetical protein